MTLNEVFKSNFSVFDNYEEAAKKEQINKFNYIETIAHQLEMDLTDVNLFDIFPNNNNIILASETEINNVLLAFNREKYFNKPDPVHEVIDMTEDQLTAIKKVYADQFAGRKRELNGNAERHMRDAANYMRRYHEHSRQASAYREQANQIKEDDATPMIDSLKKVFEDPRFKFMRFGSNRTENDTVMFQIKEDIIIQDYK